jgi:hypothetical protein
VNKRDCLSCVFLWVVLTPLLLVCALWLCGLFVAMFR